MVTALIFLATLGFGILTFCYPLLALMILIIAIPFDLPFEIGMTVYTNQLLLSVMLLAVLIRNIHLKKHAKLIAKEWVIIVAPFVMAVLLSGINAEQFSHVIKQLLYWFEIIIVAWLVINIIESKSDLKKVVMTIIIAATVTSIIGIIQTIAGPTANFNLGKDIFTIDKGITMRAYSSFGHPNQFAGYLLLVIPVAFIQFMETKDWRQRSLIGLLAIIVITALIFTFSRGGWLSMILVGSVLIYLNIPKKMKMIVSLILALTVTIFILNFGPLDKTRKAVMERVASFSQPEKEDSVSFRGVCYRTAFKMFKQHPVLGFGAGEYDSNIRNCFDEKYYAWKAINKHIHNWYVQLLIEIGLLGLISFLFILIVLMLKLIRCFLSSEPTYERQILSGVIGGILAFLVHNFFDVLTIFARGIHFGILIGLGLAVSHMLEKTDSYRMKAE